MKLNPKDLHIESWPKEPEGGMQTGKIPAGVKVTHLPTGIVYSFCEYRQQHRNKDECIRQIEERLNWQGGG